MESNIKKSLYIIGVIVIVIVVLYFIPITIPYTIDVPGKIIHSKEWILQRENDGSLVSTFYDHKSGFIKDYLALQIDRGDAIRFQLSSNILSRKHINVGDTVGTFESNMLQQQLSNLQRDLNLAKATLDVDIAGEKDEIIEAANANLALADEKLKNQNRILARQDSLYQRRLISKETFEITKSMQKVFEIELAIAKAHLEVVQSGAKSEQINLYKSDIKAIETEIQVLMERNRDFTLNSPLNGMIYSKLASDTLLTIGDTSGIVIMPIKMDYYADLNLTLPVQIEFPDSKKTSGKIIRKEEISRVLNNKQVFLVYAEMETSNQVPFGFILPCSITIKSLKPIPYIFEVMKSILI